MVTLTITTTTVIMIMTIMPIIITLIVGGLIIVMFITALTAIRELAFIIITHLTQTVIGVVIHLGDMAIVITVAGVME